MKKAINALLTEIDNLANSRRNISMQSFKDYPTVQRLKHLYEDAKMQDANFHNSDRTMDDFISKLVDLTHCSTQYAIAAWYTIEDADRKKPEQAAENYAKKFDVKQTIF